MAFAVRIYSMIRMVINTREGNWLKALGRHFLLELKDCNRDLLNDLDALKRLLREAAIECGAEILSDSFHHFTPQGVSGVVIIAESHLCIHTWPEHGYAAVDIFTCGTRVKPEIATQYLIDKLGSKNQVIIEMQRGIL
jgi:S-adenosylmethionine decarboxylase